MMIIWYHTWTHLYQSSQSAGGYLYFSPRTGKKKKKNTLKRLCYFGEVFDYRIQSHIHLIEKSYFLEPAELRVSKIVS